MRTLAFAAFPQLGKLLAAFSIYRVFFRFRSNMLVLLTHSFGSGTGTLRGVRGSTSVESFSFSSYVEAASSESRVPWRHALFCVPFSRSAVITITIGYRGRNAPPGSTPNYLLAQSLPLSLLFLLPSRTEAKSVARPGGRNKGASLMRGHFRNTMPPDGETHSTSVEVPFLPVFLAVLPRVRVECECRRRSRSRCPAV